MKTDYTKEEIIKVAKFYNKDFGIYGDEGRLQEMAEKIAYEALRYKDHKVWSVIRYRFPQLPCNRKL